MEKIFSAGLLLMLSGTFLVESEAQWPLGKEISPPTGKTSEAGMFSSGSGRHQIFVSPNIKGHTFMIDTETGKVWIFRKDSASGDYSLQRVTVEGAPNPAGEAGKK